MLQHGAKEVEMGLADGVTDADIAWPESQRGEAMEAGQFPAHCSFGGVGERLAFVVEAEESVTTGGQVDRNASRTELLEEGGSIREHGSVLGNRGPIVVSDRMDDRRGDREATGFEGTGHQRMPGPFLDFEAGIREAALPPANTVPQGVVRVAGRRRMASELLGEEVNGARELALYGGGVRLPQVLHERRQNCLLGQLRGPFSGQEDIVDVHHGESYMHSGVSPSNSRRSRRAQGTLTN